MRATSAIKTRSALRHRRSCRSGTNLSEILDCIVLVSYCNGRARVGLDPHARSIFRTNCASISAANTTDTIDPDGDGIARPTTSRSLLQLLEHLTQDRSFGFPENDLFALRTSGRWLSGSAALLRSPGGSDARCGQKGAVMPSPLMLMGRRPRRD